MGIRGKIKKYGIAITVLIMFIISVICIGTLHLNSARGNNMETEKSVFAMDTYMTVTAYGKEGHNAVKAAIDEIERLDELLSISNEKSEVYKLNSQKGEKNLKLSHDTAELIEKSLDMYKETNGAFDITVLPIMELWGFTTGQYKVPSKSEIQRECQKVGADRIRYDKDTSTITLESDQSIDFGAIAKGYTADKIAESLRSSGVESALISLGGNVQVIGKNKNGKPWKIAIADPKNPDSDFIGFVNVEDKAVVTSGTYERFFEDTSGKKWHHIMNPETGSPAMGGLDSVTIISDSGMDADVLSTSLLIMGTDKAFKYWKQHSDSFEAIFVTDENNIYITEGIMNDLVCDTRYRVISTSGEVE